MSNFDELGLSPAVLDAVAALDYEEPSPVQEQAIPLILSGRDVVAAAKTGTGKTAAFSLPVFNLMEHVHAKKGEGPFALVVTPTRELAEQIARVCNVIARKTKHRVVCLYGGVSLEPQKDKLRRGCDMVVSTPGRLLDLMGQGDLSLSQVSTLVLDEADRMLDMGFLPDVKRIVAKCPKERQTLLFSATLDEGIQSNLSNLLNDPAYVEVDHKGEVTRLIKQYRIDVDHRAKQNLLHAFLYAKGSERVIVFARTRYRVDACVRKLRKEGFSAQPIHSDRSQAQRKKALESFAVGDTDILVATDVLARGIDIERVNYVINFDMPTEAEDYVHRIGRTGRAGEDGIAVSFTTTDNKQVLKDIEKLLGHPLEALEFHWEGGDKSDAALASKVNRAAARRDPEIAEVVREQKTKNRQKRNKAAKQHEASETRDAATKSRKTRGKNAPAEQDEERQTSRKRSGGARNTKSKNARNGSQSANKKARSGALSSSKNGRTDKTGRANKAAGKKRAGGFAGDVRPGRSQRRDSRSRHA